MKKPGEQEVEKQYAAAHQAHYGSKDLNDAVELYRSVMKGYPETQEAAYARAQIDNIVKSVVPERELFDSHVELALVYLAHARARATPESRSSPPSDRVGE